MKSEETVNIFFDTAPEQNVKYYFGDNQVVQTRRTKDIVFYPFFAVPLIDMMPATIFINNNTYNTIQFQNVPVCLISIASRKGGYHFIDYPLTSYIKTWQINKNIEYDMEIDFSKSFARFTNPGTQSLPFVLQFCFKLHMEK